MLIQYIPELRKPSEVAPFAFGEVILNPGYNTINKTLWEQAMGIYGPRVEPLMEDGIIRIAQDDPVGASLSEFSVPKAVKVVEETYDPDQLRQWQADDSRSGVQKAIAKKLEELTPPPPEKK